MGDVGAKFRTCKDLSGSLYITFLWEFYCEDRDCSCFTKKVQMPCSEQTPFHAIVVQM